MQECYTKIAIIQITLSITTMFKKITFLWGALKKNMKKNFIVDENN